MIPVPPSVTTTWRRSRDKARHWYLKVEYRAGPFHIAAEYLHEPYPGKRPIHWIEFENEKVQEFLRDEVMGWDG